MLGTTVIIINTTVIRTINENSPPAVSKYSQLTRENARVKNTSFPISKHAEVTAEGRPRGRMRKISWQKDEENKTRTVGENQRFHSGLAGSTLLSRVTRGIDTTATCLNMRDQEENVTSGVS